MEEGMKDYMVCTDANSIHYTHRTKAYKRLALGFEEYTCYSTGDIDQRSGEKAVLC